MGFRVGDLLRARNKIQVGVVRIYTEQNCSEWETHVKKDELVVFLEEHQNQWGQDVLTVLFPRGIRWLYRLDAEVIQ